MFFPFCEKQLSHPHYFVKAQLNYALKTHSASSSGKTKINNFPVTLFICITSIPMEDHIERPQQLTHAVGSTNYLDDSKYLKEKQVQPKSLHLGSIQITHHESLIWMQSSWEAMSMRALLHGPLHSVARMSLPAVKLPHSWQTCLAQGTWNVATI